MGQYLKATDGIYRNELHLFGCAIHTSLERTMGQYLKATDGIYRNELREDWKLNKVSSPVYEQPS
jgi:hypothetical protein